MSSFFNKKVLSNNPLLYATAIISFLNILGFIQIGKMNIVLLYMTLALLLSVYTKNMVVVLGAPLILSNLVSYMDPTREGFTEEKGLTDNLNDSMNELNKKIEELGNLQLGNLVSTSEDEEEVEVEDEVEEEVEEEEEEEEEVEVDEVEKEGVEEEVEVEEVEDEYEEEDDEEEVEDEI